MTVIKNVKSKADWHPFKYIKLEENDQYGYRSVYGVTEEGQEVLYAVGHDDNGFENLVDNLTKPLSELKGTVLTINDENHTIDTVTLNPINIITDKDEFTLIESRSFDYISMIDIIANLFEGDYPDEFYEFSSLKANESLVNSLAKIAKRGY